MSAFRQALLWGCLLLCAVPAAQAQPFDQAGVRAQGFGGAFVAVGDDASATWWNPAALAAGPFFNLGIERQVRRREPIDLGAGPGIDQSLTGFALTMPPLGLSYYRTRYTVVAAAEGDSNRETSRTTALHATSLVTHQTGATLLHSIAAGLVVGATPKFVRGIAAGTRLPGELAVEDALDAARDLVGRASNQFDADLGVHVVRGPWRAGLAVRNVFEPSFATTEGEELRLPRQARAGVAFTATQTTLAADIDLTDAELPEQGGRRLAAGAEHRFGTRAAVRGGFGVGTGEPSNATGALGGSYAIRPSIWVDGFWAFGEHDEVRWGLAARVTY